MFVDCIQANVQVSVSAGGFRKNKHSGDIKKLHFIKLL